MFTLMWAAHMPIPSPTDTPDQTPITRDVAHRHHLAWKHRDVDAVMALYHPDITYHDFFQNRVLRLLELRDYVTAAMPGEGQGPSEYTDRIRADGDTAFIQYRITLPGGEGQTSFISSEAITVRDGLIWRINEYATLMRAAGGLPHPVASRPALQRLGLSTRQLGVMADELQLYFQRQRPYLDPDLDLQQVADATGYSRNQLSYLLNQVLGQSFYRYVNQARLQHLLTELSATTDATADAGRVDELAFAAGFNSLSAFYRCFRQHTGLSPKAYIKQTFLRARTHDKG